MCSSSLEGNFFREGGMSYLTTYIYGVPSTYYNNIGMMNWNSSSRSHWTGGLVLVVNCRYFKTLAGFSDAVCTICYLHGFMAKNESNSLVKK